MDGKRLFHSIGLANFLSYGDVAAQITLKPLNVLIGQNASGKSNFLHAIELLRSAPANLATFLYQGGGVEEWLYKGEGVERTAEIQAAVQYPEKQDTLNHSISFTAASNGQRLQIINEAIASTIGREAETAPTNYYNYYRGEPRAVPDQVMLGGLGLVPFEGRRELPLKDIKPDLSILSQRSDPDTYPALAYLAQQYRSIRVYRDFNMEGPSSMRRAQQPDLPSDFLEEDGRNLSLVLNDLQHQGMTRIIVEKLQAVYEDVKDISVRVAGGTVQTFLWERGLSSPIPAARLSDGTLRYLCLLAILYHPAPPPLICLEEPEVGLHPDLISGLAKMLKEASQRTQLIVTTHSDLLVSKFSEEPEAVVVCERTPDGTTLERLDSGKLESWLEEYSLGDVWLRGGIGGTRW